MEQVADDVKKTRSSKLETLTSKQRSDFVQSQIGEKARVIWETEHEGLTDNYIRIRSKEPHEPRSISEEVLTEEMTNFK